LGIDDNELNTQYIPDNADNMNGTIGYMYPSMEALAASNTCSGSIDVGGEGQWDDTLEGCGNFDNLPSNIQTAACEAFYNLDDPSDNPSLAQWIQDNGATAECCESAGIPEPEGQPDPQGMPAKPDKLPTKGSKSPKDLKEVKNRLKNQKQNKEKFLSQFKSQKQLSEFKDSLKLLINRSKVKKNINKIVESKYNKKRKK
jgi:hypothetical protein